VIGTRRRYDTKYNNLQKSLKEMQDSSSVNLLKHATSFDMVNEQLQNHAKGMINHRDTLRDCKSTMEKTSKALFEYKNKTDNQVLSLQESIDNIEKRLRRNDTSSKQLEILSGQSRQYCTTCYANRR